MLWLRDCPHLVGNSPCPSPLIDYWMETTWFLPSPRLVSIMKAPGEEKHPLSASILQLCLPCSLLYFPSLTFNKLHLHPCVLPWILPHKTQRIWKTSDYRLHSWAIGRPCKSGNGNIQSKKEVTPRFTLLELTF
jgi:hypothetical protein